MPDVSSIREGGRFCCGDKPREEALGEPSAFGLVDHTPDHEREILRGKSVFYHNNRQAPEIIRGRAVQQLCGDGEKRERSASGLLENGFEDRDGERGERQIWIVGGFFGG